MHNDMEEQEDCAYRSESGLRSGKVKVDLPSNV